MYKNLKNDDFNLRGEVGELIAKYELPGSFRTKDVNKNYLKYLNKNNKINKPLTDFLHNNWSSFDLIAFEKDEIGVVRHVTLYEVKTRKYFFSKLTKVFYKDKVTKNFLRICDEALNMGMGVKHVQITFFEDWKYGFKIKDFSTDNFLLDKRRNHR